MEAKKPSREDSKDSIEELLAEIDKMRGIHNALYNPKNSEFTPKTQEANERNNRVLFLKAFKRLGASLFKELKVQPDETLLELGCGGRAFFGKHIMPRKFKNQIIHTDSEPTLIKESQRLDPKGKYTVADATNLQQIPDDFIDRIFVANLFNAIPEEISRQILMEINRVLKPGGYCHSITDLAPSPDAIEEAAAKKFKIQLENLTIGSQQLHHGIRYCICDKTDPERAHPLTAPQIDPALFFSSEILDPLFSKYFDNNNSSAVIARERIFTHHLLAGLFITNSATCGQEITSILPPKARKRVINKSELPEYRLHTLRTVAFAMAHINTGQKPHDAPPPLHDFDFAEAYS